MYTLTYNVMWLIKQDKNRAVPWRARVVFLAALARLVCCGQTTNLAVTPSADAFVRSLAPADNYGAAGARSVSGSAAVNGSGQQNGLFDTLIRFPMADLAESMNGSFGTNGWLITGVVLTVSEVAAPNNPIFNQGVGAFEIRWIASDTWQEGTGTPMQPTMDGVAYQDLASVLNASVDVSLGQFTNSGVSQDVSFSLPLAGALVSNILVGADVNLYLTAASASVGFTFNSRNYTQTNAWPGLVLTAVPKLAPRISSVERSGTGQVTIRFNTASNWTYTLQDLAGLPAGPERGWSNLFTVPAKPSDSQSVFVDGETNAVRLYRLVLTP